MRTRSDELENSQQNGISRRMFLTTSGVIAGITWLSVRGLSLCGSVSATESDSAPSTILVDDFAPQPSPACGEGLWYYNRLGGDRGTINDAPGRRTVEWGRGFVKMTIMDDTSTYLGVFTSCNHTIREGMPLNFASIYPPQILGRYQGHVTGLRVHIVDGRGRFQAELQMPDLSFPWRESVPLQSGKQTLEFALPALLQEIRSLNCIVVGSTGDFVKIDRVELIVNLPSLSTAESAFLASYAMLLANFNASTGLTRDRANFPAGDFDNVAASGMQAAAAVVAWRLGFISNASAIDIVERTSSGVLSLRRCHGLLPHFVTHGEITPNTEWSTIDTIIAVIAILEARQALSLPTNQVEQILTGIDWATLILPDGSISHGFSTDCSQRLPNGWKDFGTESWLANLGYAAGFGEIATMDATPPTFNGSGFIAELAWLLVPPPIRDGLGIEWWQYRQKAVDTQISYYKNVHPYPCYNRFGLFGLSAAEVPERSLVACEEIYQALGVGGESPPNDGTPLMPYPVIAVHYAGMVSSLRPAEATSMWRSLQDAKLFTTLNNVESLMADGACSQVVWSDLKGSWNLSLQTLGWGQLLAGDDYPLYQGLCKNDLLRKGYMLMLGRPPEALCGPEFKLKLNKLSFQAGDTLTLTAHVTPDSTTPVVDKYIALQFPDRSILFLQPNKSFGPFSPMETNWTVGPSDWEVFSYNFGGNEPVGSYSWWAMLTEAGTSKIVSLIAHAPFIVTRS